jgi:hypothetical protein
MSEVTKQITLTCLDCGKSRTFDGVALSDILNAIDLSKWRDLPDGALCPECDARRDAEYER